MKRLFKSTTTVFATSATVLFLSCGDKDNSPSPANCSTNAEKVTAAAQTYSQSPTKANCEAYKGTVKDFYMSCATFYTGATKDALDEFLAEPCP
ncbi:MAG TPA: hypothetical protein VGN64_21705 [Dyadobacter sp.]|nr:hypothetical protein [Dyadobacter sp.]